MATKQDKAASAAAGDVAEKIAAEQEQGFLGVKVDPEPNSAYTLESGPSSPGQLPDDRTRYTQPEVRL